MLCLCAAPSLHFFLPLQTIELTINFGLQHSSQNVCSVNTVQYLSDSKKSRFGHLRYVSNSSVELSKRSDDRLIYLFLYKAATANAAGPGRAASWRRPSRLLKADNTFRCSAVFSSNANEDAAARDDSRKNFSAAVSRARTMVELSLTVQKLQQRIVDTGLQVKRFLQAIRVVTGAKQLLATLQFLRGGTPMMGECALTTA